MFLLNHSQAYFFFPAPAAASQAAAVIGCAAARDMHREPGSFSLD
jgi:hypothetical protein